MFGATCEHCLDTVYMTNDQADYTIGAQGEFLCDDCLDKPREKSQRKRPSGVKNWAREVGCTVTIRTTDGNLRETNRSGQVRESLQAIISTLAEGEKITTISTPASILHDLRNQGRPTGDPYRYEKQLLSRIGRMDLL